MQIEGKTVIFETGFQYFGPERDGYKPYTVRILTEEEAEQLLNTGVNRVRIVHPNRPDESFFERHILSVYTLDTLLGKTLVGIAWEHKEDEELPDQ